MIRDWYLRWLLALTFVLTLLSEAAVGSEPMPPTKSPRQTDLAILRNLTVHHNFLIWPAGGTISVCFFAEQLELRQAFVDAARRWELDANIIFDFGSTPNYNTCDGRTQGDVRVRFSNTLAGISAGNSMIGTSALTRKPDQPTLNIAGRSVYTGDVRRQEALTSTILHEIGHALGLPHEHQHSQSVCLAEHLFHSICAQTGGPGVDSDKNADLQRKRVDLYRMLPRRLDPVPAWDFAYDVNSIMHYHFQARHLKSGTASPCFTNQPRVISVGDRARLGVLYPREVARQRDFLKGQIEVFRKTVKVMGLSRPTGERMADIVRRNLHRRHVPAGLEVTVADLNLTEADTSDLEEQFAYPVPPPLPPECKEPAFAPLPALKPNQPR